MSSGLTLKLERRVRIFFILMIKKHSGTALQPEKLGQHGRWGHASACEEVRFFSRINHLATKKIAVFCTLFNVFFKSGCERATLFLIFYCINIRTEN
jgi:hypothetical protein